MKQPLSVPENTPVEILTAENRPPCIFPRAFPGCGQKLLRVQLRRQYGVLWLSWCRGSLSVGKQHIPADSASGIFPVVQIRSVTGFRDGSAPDQIFQHGACHPGNLMPE